MTFRTQSEKDKAEKKVQIAIDKMIDLQDMGVNTERILDSLRSLESDICAASVIKS